eukprot:5162295-Amphidinium_carterae.1
MDEEDNRFIRRMQRGRGLAREPRRADALHPHLDSSPENPNDYWGSDDDSSPDPFDHELYGGGAEHPEQHNEEEEQETTLREDLEEEARERDEVTSVSPENVTPPPIPPWLLLDNPEGVRAAVVATREATHAEAPHRPNPMLGRSWLWGQDDDHEMHPEDPWNQIMGKGRLPTRILMPNQWTDRIASKAMPRPWFESKGKGAGKSREGRAKGSGTTSVGGGTGSMASQSEEAAEEEQQQPTVDEPEPEQLVLEHMAPAAEPDDPFDREDAQDDPYNLGMMHGWDASSSDGGAASEANAKDAVHELEWD